MLKELFESSFFTVYPLRRNVSLCLFEEEYQGLFSLADQVACESCIYPCGDEKVQLSIESNKSVHVIKLDQVFEILNEDVGKNCDYLLDNNDVIVLVEMTCCSDKFSGSKRQKAKGQLYNTLNILLSVGTINLHINDKSKRYVVFSWKDTTLIKDTEDIVDINMSNMTILNDEVYSIDNESKFDFGFLYKEVRFPDCLNFDTLQAS